MVTQRDKAMKGRRAIKRGKKHIKAEIVGENNMKRRYSSICLNLFDELYDKL
jgi:hypothetical protein